MWCGELMLTLLIVCVCPLRPPFPPAPPLSSRGVCVRAQFIMATTQKKGPEWNPKTQEWEAELLGACEKYIFVGGRESCREAGGVAGRHRQDSSRVGTKTRLVWSRDTAIYTV